MGYEKIKKLKEGIKNIEEPRRTRYGNIRHKLEDLRIIGLCIVICGGEDYADMEGFDIEREEFLQIFLELPNTIPNSDTLVYRKSASLVLGCNFSRGCSKSRKSQFLA